MTRFFATVVLLLFICLQGLDTSATSCDNSCDTDSSCDAGFYCCNSQCVAALPGLGESCPCSRCNSDILLCKQGVCVFNGVNCTCNNASDCSSDGSRSATCVNNICGIQQDAPMNPPYPSTIGQSCVTNSSCSATRYCNSSQVCDYTPPGWSCSALSDFCSSGYVCAGYVCRPRRAVSETCEANEQCPTSYTCRADSESSQQYCTTKGKVGDYCTEVTDCNNMNCVNNACYAPVVGEQCWMGGYCANGLVCRFGKCAQNVTISNGSPCQRSIECTSGICSDGLCWPMSYTSGSCNVSLQCPDGRCVNGKCFSIAYYNEKCNATQVCYDENRPCVNGTCPRLYSAYGEYCAVNEHCLFGTCLSNSCGFPSTCNVSSDCGLNSICDCGQCKPNRIAIYDSYAHRPSIYLGLAFQMSTRRPDQTCLFDANAPNCETTLAKYNCFVKCGAANSWGFPNGILNNNINNYLFPLQLDCKALTYSKPTNAQPCCNAYNQTACNTNPFVGCYEFNLANFEPLLRVPEAPHSTPQAISTPLATPTAESPSSQNTPSAAPSTVPTQNTPSAAPSTTPVTSTPVATPANNNPTPTAVPTSTTPVPVTCNCAAPTPHCDTSLNVCVGLRVTPIIQCVQHSNAGYIALMSYDNHQSTVVTLDDTVNFLNLAVSDKPRNFDIGRSAVFPQSAFNVTSATPQQVSWYLDGYELKFDISDRALACPEDVTFVMTSSATVEQLQAISNEIIGNLSAIMSVPESRLNVTFSSISSKRQTSTTLITVVILSSNSSSEPTPFAAALQFIQTDSVLFTERVPAARVEQVTASPLPNEQTGSETVTPPTTNSPQNSSPPPSRSPRAVVSPAQNTIVHAGLIMLVLTVLFS